MRKAMKNRTGSGISAPNSVSNIAPPVPPGDLACPFGIYQESPEWLTPAAIFAAFNPNKGLRKSTPWASPSTCQRITMVNGGLMANRENPGI
jgi:hypothetical protein